MDLPRAFAASCLGRAKLLVVAASLKPHILTLLHKAAAFNHCNMCCNAPTSAQILNQLEQCKAFPDFNNYLAFIFAQADSLPLEVSVADRRWHRE